MRVLILPDLFEDTSRWDTVVAAFARQNILATVFSYETPKDDDVSLQVDATSQFLIDETYVIGFGVGGRIALQLAARKPHHLAGITVIGTEAVPTAKTTAWIVKIIKFLTLPIRIIIPGRLRRLVVALYYKIRVPDAKLTLYKQVATYDLEAFFIKITTTCLLLYGKKDQDVPPRSVAHISDTLNEYDVPHEVIIVTGAKRALHTTHPDIVVNSTLSRIN